MIKIVKVTYVHARVLELVFSDGAVGQYDLLPLYEQQTVLTKAWDDLDYFRSFFVELGAIGWPNGLELSPRAIHQTLAESGRLTYPQRVA